MFQLDPNLGYRIFLHDPLYFAMATNPLVFPRIWKDYKAEDLAPNLMEWIYISVTEHRLLNQPDQPCEEDAPGYDFMKCVKNSHAMEVGCRPSWDTWSEQTIPLCTTMEELRMHEKLDWQVYNVELKVVINKTNCKVPCHYKEYAVVGEPQEESGSVIGPPAKE